MIRNNYNDYKLDFTQDCIFGQIGLSVSLDSVILITNTIFNYCNLKGVQTVVIGYDSSKWSRKFAVEVVISRLCELGMPTQVIDISTTSAIHSWAVERAWLDSEKSVNVLGLYFATDETQSDTLSIHFKNNNGLPFTEAQTTEVVAQSFRVEIVELEDIARPRPEIVNLDRYLTYLTNTDLLDKQLLKGSVISIDNMFGSSEDLIQKLKIEFLFQGQLTNKASENLRIENYRSIPSERWLQWKVPNSDHPLSHNKNLLFHSAISNDGSKLGIWDLKESVEISPSGLMLIFMKYLAETKKKKGTIIVSKILSDKVLEAAKFYKLKVLEVDSGIDKFSEMYLEAGKRSALMYGDEFGRFWFKGQTLQPNGAVALLLLAQICTKFKLSPGQIVDHISKKSLKRKYVFGKLFIPTLYCSKENLETIIRRDTIITVEDIGSTSIFRTEDGAKISLVQDKKEDLILVEVESLDEDTTRLIIQNLQEKCFLKESDDEDNVDHLTA